MHYFDTSALVKLLVVDERGTEAMIALMQEPTGHLTSRLGLVETASALSRMAREGRLSPLEADQLIAAVQCCAELGLVLVELDEEVQAKAAQCLRRHPLKASDAVHLASALHAGAQVVVCSDGALFAAAQAEGLLCVDPTAPPGAVPES